MSFLFWDETWVMKELEKAEKRLPEWSEEAKDWERQMQSESEYYEKHLSTPELVMEWLDKKQQEWYELQESCNDYHIDDRRKINVMDIMYRNVGSYKNELLLRVLDGNKIRPLYIYDAYDPGSYDQPPDSELCFMWDCCPIDVLEKISNFFRYDTGDREGDVLAHSYIWAERGNIGYFYNDRLADYLKNHPDETDFPYWR